MVRHLLNNVAANDGRLLNNVEVMHRRLPNNVAANDGRLLNNVGANQSFAATMLTKRPLFSRVYAFVVPSVPRL